jgi:hypothetical protein
MVLLGRNGEGKLCVEATIPFEATGDAGTSIDGFCWVLPFC